MSMKSHQARSPALSLSLCSGWCFDLLGWWYLIEEWKRWKPWLWLWLCHTKSNYYTNRDKTLTAISVHCLSSWIWCHLGVKCTEGGSWNNPGKGNDHGRERGTGMPQGLRNGGRFREGLWEELTLNGAQGFLQLQHSMLILKGSTHLTQTLT